MNKTEDFLAKLEGFLEKEVGGNWYYEFETEGYHDNATTLNFKTFNVWGKQFNEEEDE
tara:strand:- start:47 stop:220 length:174 start_codon:yes stop_codon:yes gene_type:complete